MKIIRNFFLISGMIVFLSCDQTNNSETSADSDVTPSESVNSESAEEEVAAAVDSLNNAIVNPDRNVLDSLAAEELTYGHSGGLIQNKEEFIDDLINGDFDFSSVNGEDQEIFISGETAVVRQMFVAEATNQGEPVDIRIGNMLVYQKQDDQWKLLARQAFRL